MVMRCRWSARGLTAPGYHHGARGREYCVIRNPHKVSGFEAPRDNVSRIQVASRPQARIRRSASVVRFRCSLLVVCC